MTDEPCRVHGIRRCTICIDLDRCPKCGTPITPQRGHPSLCLPCTEREIGMTARELRSQVTAALQKGRTREWSMLTTPGARRWNDYHPDTT